MRKRNENLENDWKGSRWIFRKQIFNRTKVISFRTILEK